MATKKVKRYDGEDGSLVTPDEEATVDTTPAAAAPAAKPKIVTMEELAKSGLSLRDYLNKQQGLTRRGSSAPSTAGGSGRGVRGGPTAEELDAYADRNKSAVERIPRDKSTVPAGESASGSELGRNIENTSNAMLGTRVPAAVVGVIGERAAAKRAAAAAENAIAERAARVAARRTAAAERGPRPESMSKFAKGGSVSASRRADGIASKGKTRGRVC